MRPFEILLSLLNCVVFLSIWFARLNAGLGVVLLSFAAVMAAIAQWSLEGARWQMVPAYGFSAGLLAYSLWSGISQRNLSRLNVSTVNFIQIASAGFGIVVLALAILLPIAVPVFHFPPPAGPCSIGTVTYHWVDQTRGEVFTADPSDLRELMVQVWYPTKADASASRARYLPDGAALAPVAKLLNLPGYIFTHLNQVATNAVPSAPVAKSAANDARL